MFIHVGIFPRCVREVPFDEKSTQADARINRQAIVCQTG